MQFVTFSSLEDLNNKTHDWIEREYNCQHHTGIQMIPIDRFNLDHARIHFLPVLCEILIFQKYNMITY